MNVYEKLNAARLRIQKSSIRKSGKNSFAGYSYYELSDFLPIINQAAADLGFSCLVRFGRDEATLEFLDTEKPEERITFTSPMSAAELKGCHPVQNLGAVETYIRRYLYVAAFEIVEADALDAAAGEPQSSPAEKPRGKAAGAWTKEEADEMARLLGEKYPDGEAIFGKGDKDAYRKELKEKGGAFSLNHLKKDYEGRLKKRQGELEELDRVPF